MGPRLDPELAAASYPSPAADGRGWKYSGEVNGWPISSEPTTSTVDLDERAFGLSVEGDLADRRDHQWVDDTGEHGEDDEHADGGRQLAAQHQETPRALMSRSMSLMPTNGAMIPPKP